MTATAKGLLGHTKIWGRLPVLVNGQIKFGMGIDLDAKSQSNETDRKKNSEIKNPKIVIE